MWDERYRSKEYAYGTEPNQFLKQNFHHLPKGRILSLAEGEGRNAVFLAQQGYSVTAVDTSIVGLHKAQKWAEANGVTVNWVHADLADYDFGNHEWDGIVSIFCPLLPAVRKKMYDRLQLGLKQSAGSLYARATAIRYGGWSLGRFHAIEKNGAYRTPFLNISALGGIGTQRHRRHLPYRSGFGRTSCCDQAKNSAGSTIARLSITLQCRCAPVARPVAPTAPNKSPVRTVSPTLTAVLLKWHTMLSKPPP